MNPMQYLVNIEKSENGFEAYVPDLPGCAAELRRWASRTSAGEWQ
jgi:hypothetical protein